MFSRFLQRDCCLSHEVVGLPITQHEAVLEVYVSSEYQNKHSPTTQCIVLEKLLMATAHTWILFSLKTETITGPFHLDILWHCVTNVIKINLFFTDPSTLHPSYNCSLSQLAVCGGGNLLAKQPENLRAERDLGGHLLQTPVSSRKPCDNMTKDPDL